MLLRVLLNDLSRTIVLPWDTCKGLHRRSPPGFPIMKNSTIWENLTECRSN